MGVCIDCKVLKGDSEFHKNKNRSDGLQPWCKPCATIRKKKWRAANPEKYKATTARRYHGNVEREKMRKAAWYKENREHTLRVNDDWRKLNMGSTRGRVAKRRAALVNAVPKWLSTAQLGQIEAVYNHARDCRAVSGQEYHVDHVVPVIHPDVCGLHVPWNLQVLPQDVNDSKGNSFDGGW